MDIDIVKLEIKNLSNEDKKILYDVAKNEWPQTIKPSQEWEKFESYQALDKALKLYFWEFPDMFIKFQSIFPGSLYNQAVKENNFVPLRFEDVVKGLTLKQSERVIWQILRSKRSLSSPEYPVAFVEKIDKEYLAKYEKFPKSEQMKMPFPYQKLYSGEELEQYNQNSFVLIEYPFHVFKPLPEVPKRVTVSFLDYLDMDEKYLSALKCKKTFFKNEDELILFGLNNPCLAPALLRFHEKYLNPHYKVNKWIEIGYELDQLKKRYSHLNCKDQKKCKH
ncbi:hypothetical protein Q4502_01985 [Mesomycoplasma ovipneumoniae]|uniref:hypothetical protein n=1 Tax=Mesomycoplasma ovipneumoniae TaxID=29562 RepID=UPI0026E30499|nr:hypothetical protein [Mesomycoplasma ovipneumoniae]MDO6856472.1 hypothetical protein [Mesomycoplasma ovipneumoniae]